MNPEAEVLERAAPHPPSRRVWVVIASLILVAGAAWGVDEVRRGREDAALTSCRDHLLRADREAATRLSRVAGYIHPALVSLPAEQARRLAAPMQSPARIALPSVRAAVAACRQVRVWSWHEPDHSRREDTVAYADALLSRLEQIAGDGSIFFSTDRRLAQLRARADLS